MAAPVSEVYFMDCMEGMKKMADKKFAHAVVDTNWGIGESSRDHKSRNTPIKQKSGKVLHAPVLKYQRQDWDDKQPEQTYFDELFRVAEKKIIMGENYLEFDQKWLSSGRIFWNKVNGDNDFSDGELFWTDYHSSVKLITYMRAGAFQGKSLAEPEVQQGNKRLNEKRLQSAHKPILLYMCLFMRYITDKKPILDTHVGGGSARIAAYDLGIDYYGFENNAANFRAQHLRFERHRIKAELYRGY